MTDSLRTISQNGLENLIIKGRQAINVEQLIIIVNKLNPESAVHENLQNSILITAGILVEDWKEIQSIRSPSETQNECVKVRNDIERLGNFIDAFRFEQRSFEVLIKAYRQFRQEDEKENEMSSFVRALVISNEMSNMFLRFNHEMNNMAGLLKIVESDMENLKGGFRRNPKEGTKMAISSLAITYKEITGLQPTYTNPTETSTSNSKGAFFEFVVSVLSPIYRFINAGKSKQFPSESIGKVTHAVVKDYKENPGNHRLYY